MTGLQLHFLDGGVLKRCNYVAGLNLAEPGTRHLIIGVTGGKKYSFCGLAQDAAQVQAG